MSAPASTTTRRRRLQEATQALHAELDRAVMLAKPFADSERYGRFLAMQYRLHAASAPLYADTALAGCIADLADRGRAPAYAADLADLGLAPPRDVPPTPIADADRGFALGWLYVIEGSSLGAAFLAKAAAKLGYDAARGAHGLAEPAGGRGPAWQRFVTALEEAPLDAAEEAQLDDGARAAFAYAQRLADAL